MHFYPAKMFQHNHERQHARAQQCRSRSADCRAAHGATAAPPVVPARRSLSVDSVVRVVPAQDAQLGAPQFGAPRAEVRRGAVRLAASAQGNTVQAADAVPEQVAARGRRRRPRASSADSYHPPSAAGKDNFINISIEK